MAVAAEQATDAPPLLEVLEEWLLLAEQPKSGFMPHPEKEGYYSLQEALDSCPQLQGLGLGAAVVILLTAGREGGPVGGDDSGQWIRLRGLEERLQGAAEQHICTAGAGISLIGLLQEESIQAILSPAYTGMEEQLALLRSCLDASSRVAVANDIVVPLQEAHTAKLSCPVGECHTDKEGSEGRSDTRVPSPDTSSGGDFMPIGTPYYQSTDACGAIQAFHG